jgi:DNA-binding NarL/FixJ family response regulator
MDCGDGQAPFYLPSRMPQRPEATNHDAAHRLHIAVRDAAAGLRAPVSDDELAAFAREIRPDADARIEIEWVNGEPLIVVRAIARMPPGPELAVLSPRELEVAGLIARGLTNAEIAAQLGIRVGTVKDHVHQILERLGVRSRQRIVALVVADLERGRRTHLNG